MKRGVEGTLSATDDLIQGLARQAGRARPGHFTFGPVLAGATVLAFVAALAVVLSAAGARSDLRQIAQDWMFQFKVAAVALTAICGAALVRAVAIPGSPVRPWLVMAPALLLALVALVADPSGFPLSGIRASSVPVCVGTIVMASAPALAIVLVALRRGIVTRPRRAGAAAGLLAGSLGSLAYTIACLNDGMAFVVLWYGAAIAIVAAVGAALGRKALAW